MSVSALFGTRLAVAPAPALGGGGKAVKLALSPAVSGGVGVTIECSSRPKKKATAHHMKTRPRKSQPWDIRRGPTVYPPLPPLPPDWTLVSPASSNEAPAAPPVPESPTPSESQ
uniref:50S ribosomal protein 6, chloroplastic n=1 Tax=Opuntia streptacantha TaxID=393608 RepID=A0A7C9CL60_OPUST